MKKYMCEYVARYVVVIIFLFDLINILSRLLDKQKKVLLSGLAGGRQAGRTQ